MGLALTASATTAVLARILGKRIDELTAAIHEAIVALESGADMRPADQEIADKLREVL